MKKHRWILSIAITLLTILFVSVFKNISYPLFWNDEGDTVVFAERVIKYGYPKVHDGKNVVYGAPISMSVGVDKRSDANLYDSWLKYYYAAPWVFLAGFTDDIYLKTAVIRGGFALAGVAGLFIFALSLRKLFRENSAEWLWFCVFFLIFEILSVSMTLHLRDARHYSLMVLICSGLFYVGIRYHILNQMRFPPYTLASILLLFLLFNSFFPLYVIFLTFICLHEVITIVKKIISGKGALPQVLGTGEMRGLVAPLISVLTVIPLISYFRLFEASAVISMDRPFSLEKYFKHLNFLFEFFSIYEFLYLFLLIKALLIAAWFFYRWKGSRFPSETKKKIRASNYLTLFFVLHAVIIPRVPLGIFERYFIVLQPVLVVIFLLDAFAILELPDRLDAPMRGRLKTASLALMVACFSLSLTGKVEPLRGHAYELFHRYRGPLDYVIPYIKANYERPEDLIIATNYEELCYIYYLGSKVIIGFVENNITEDLKETPDIIIHRKRWRHDPIIFQSFLKKVRYHKILFPVFDYPVNNNPELHYRIRHLFRTPWTKDPNEQLEVWVRL